MDGSRFDRWTRAFSRGPIRRRTVLPVALAFLSLARGTADVVAGLGCKPLGAKCRRSNQCCAGACRGNKGKKRCRGAGCRVTPATCGSDIGCVTEFGFVGECLPRLGGGVYCASGQSCQFCDEDSDCVAAFGGTAACIACPDECAGTGGRKCAGNAVD